MSFFVFLFFDLVPAVPSIAAPPEDLTPDQTSAFPGITGSLPTCCSEPAPVCTRVAASARTRLLPRSPSIALCTLLHTNRARGGHSSC